VRPFSEVILDGVSQADTSKAHGYCLSWYRQTVSRRHHWISLKSSSSRCYRN